MERGVPTTEDGEWGRLRRLRLHERPPGYEKIWHSLLGLAWADPYWLGEPVVPFRPEGLVIWDAPPGALVQQAQIGMDHQVKVSHAPVPARWFASGDNYQQIAEAIAAGKDPPGWCSWKVMYPGLRMQLTLMTSDGRPLGPESGVELCMWGLSVHG